MCVVAQWRVSGCSCCAFNHSNTHTHTHTHTHTAQISFQVAASDTGFTVYSFSAPVFNGFNEQFVGSPVERPTLRLSRNVTYTFNVGAVNGNVFCITFTGGVADSKNRFDSGVTNNCVGSGQSLQIRFTTALNLPGDLYYQSMNASDFGGSIVVNDYSK